MTSRTVNQQNRKERNKENKEVATLGEGANPYICFIISGLIHREDLEVNDETASINNHLVSY